MKISPYIFFVYFFIISCNKNIDDLTNIPDTNDPWPYKVYDFDSEGNIIVNPPEDTTSTTNRKKEKVKSDYYSKPDSIKKGEQIVNQVFYLNSLPIKCKNVQR